MISVVIPCYNAAPYIAETINSILEQSVDVDVEIIVVDDGSTDDSVDVVMQFSDPRISYHRQENKGVSAARNRGLEIALGEYLVFFDADDKMSPSFLQSRVKAIRESGAGFACGSIQTFPVTSAETWGAATDVAHIFLTYKPGFSSCPSNYLIRTSVLAATHLGFNEKLSSTADRYFLIELAQKTNGVLTKEAPLLYRVTPDSMSNKITRKLFLDNEQYLHELHNNGLIPAHVAKEFSFKISYILGLGFTKTGLFSKGMRYTVSAFLTSPQLFLKQII